MKTIFLMVVLSVFVLAVACERAPELPNDPQISIQNIQFRQGGPSTDVDTLVLYLDFEDGNGDLGLSGSGIDFAPPYNPFNFVTDTNGDLISIGSSDDLPEFNDRDWYIVRNTQGVPTDTVLIEQNPFHFNILVDILERQPSGQYELYDFTAFQQVPGFYGRFPRLKEESEDRALVGTIRYAMQSRAWLLLFATDSLKLRVSIRDRALNQSNVVESQPFVLLNQ